MNTGISTICAVSQGTFASEYFVKINKINGVWEGAVDKEMVLLDKEPTGNVTVDGRIYSYLISYDNSKALIELPVDDSAPERRIFVSLDAIQKERIPA